MARKIYHVIPAGDEWRVKRIGAYRADSMHGRKSDAVARARVLARGKALRQVCVHGKDGRIQAEYTYGRDPRRTRG
jgi:hypothetical protein